MSKPLESFRISDFSQFMSGLTCALLLSDSGAEVTKIRNPSIGDDTRYGNIIDREVSGHFVTHNRGKESIALNTKDEAYKKLFLKLVKTADVVIEDYKLGIVEEFGTNYEVPKEISPEIVFTPISGYGQDEPYTSHAVFNQTVQTESDMVSITDPKGGRSVKSGGSAADYSGGLMACIGTLMGILEAQKTERSRRVDVSMADSLIFCLENQFSSHLMTGKVPRPMDNSYTSSVPIGACKCKDGEPLMITIGADAQWKTSYGALNQPQQYANGRWATMAQRAADHKAIDAEVNRVFSRYGSDRVTDMLFKGKCVYGRINDFGAAVSHPQVRHCRTIMNVGHADGVTFRVLGNPILMDDLEQETDYMTAELGENIFEALDEVTGQETLHRLFDLVLEKAAEAQKAVYSKSR